MLGQVAHNNLNDELEKWSSRERMLVAAGFCIGVDIPLLVITTKLKKWDIDIVLLINIQEYSANNLAQTLGHVILLFISSSVGLFTTH